MGCLASRAISVFKYLDNNLGSVSAIGRDGLGEGAAVGAAVGAGAVAAAAAAGVCANDTRSRR